MKKLLLILFLFFLINNNSQAQNSSSTVILPIIYVSPNPATNTNIIKFKFRRSYERGYHIQIYNFLGKKMFEAHNLSEENNVNISDFNRGLYIYQLFDRKGKVVESGKFQVSRSS